MDRTLGALVAGSCLRAFFTVCIIGIIAAATIAVSLRTVGTAEAADPAAFQVRSGQAHWTSELNALFDSSDRDDPTAAVWLYLRDKEIYDSESCLEALTAHVETVNGAALRRRQNALPEPWVDFYDLPVSDDYLAGLRSFNLEVRQVSRWLNAVSVNVTRGQLDQALSLPFVSDARPVRRGVSHSELGIEDESTPTTAASSARAGDPFDYGPSRGQLDLMNAVRAHEAGYSGEGIIIAVFDTGFLLDHDAFAALQADGRLLDQYDFVNDDANVDNEPADNPASNSHGTSTWSVLGGLDEGNLVGVAHGASFLLCKTEDITSETSVEEDNWVAAAEWAEARGAQVFSTSLTYVDWYEYADLDGNTAPMTIASDIAVSRGIAVCVSAGNLGAVPWFYIGVPADADSVLAVGAVDSRNLLAEFSSHGPTSDGRLKPEVVAQGVDTYAAIPNTFGSDYFPLSGTSLSAPLVAGAAALVLEAHPSWTGWQVREALLETAVSFTVPNNNRGHGLVDTWGAITHTVPTSAPTAAQSPILTAWPVPSFGSVQFRLESPDSPGNENRSPEEPDQIDGDSSGSGWAVQIFAPSGRQVFASRNVSASWNWDGRSSAGRALPPGIYFVRATADDWQATQKIVLRR